MTRITFACCLLALCFVSTCSYGQQSLPKTLLWRISGKGLKKPSYVYGTIHLTDKRLFNLGDSVYQSIEKSEGLAIEVNPDEMAAYYVNKSINEAEGARLQELLKEKDFKKYSGPLSKKFGKPASEITTGDIVVEKNKWLRDYLAKGEMPTFLDAYLYNIARRQGKWVGGVEDISDQAGLLNQLVDKSDIDNLLAGDSTYIKNASNKLMERMVNVYCNQDLAGIEQITSEESPGFKDVLLIKRNVKMARRIDSLTALRTMFIAIGSAHLPGDSGVIQLLQKRGFTVEPVFSTKKINVNDYTFKEIKLPWAETEDKDGLYKVSLPGNAASVKVYGLIEMKFFTDLFNMSNYGAMAVVSARKADNKDSLYLELAQRMFRTQEKLTAKKVHNNGIEGNEYQHTMMGEKMRVQAYMYENIMYVAFMTSLKQETLTSPDAEHFFSSFTITKKLPASAAAKPFVDSVMGIAFMTPAELSYNKKMSTDKEAWHISAFTGTDVANGMYIFLFSKDIVPGAYLSSDTLVQSDLIANLKRQFAGLKTDSAHVPGYNGIHLRGANTLQAGIYMQAVSLIRNNRNIVLMVVADSLHQQAPVTRNIFSTLRFIPPPAMPWNTYTSADSSFSARVPGPFRKYDRTDDKTFFFSFDTTTTGSYYIRPDTLSKYTWYKQDSLFWENTVKRYSTESRLISETALSFNGQPAKEILTNLDYSYKRTRLLLHNNIVYEVFILGDSNFVTNADATAYLNSFTIHTPLQNRNFVTQSKATLLLKDLTSKDSATRTEANLYLENGAFDRQDVPALHLALLKQYQSLYDDTISDFINMKLADELGKLKDTTTIAFIKEQYPSLINEREYLKNTALTTLANLHTRESYAAIAHLLEQYNPPAEGLDVRTLFALRDSLSLLAPIFPTIQKLAKDSASCTNVAEIARWLKNKDYIKQEQIAVAANDYIQTATKYLAALKKEEGVFYMANLLEVIASFNSTAGNNLLKKFLTVKDFEVGKQAALLLIKNKQPVPAGVILKLAASAGTRKSLYEELKTLKKTNLFPQQYATQQAIGESAVYEYASEDYSVKKITFLTKKTAKLNGKSYTFYLYRVVLEDEDGAYLGVAGGFKPGSTSLEIAEDVSSLYWKEAYKESNINSLFKAFIENIQKNETD